MLSDSAVIIPVHQNNMADDVHPAAQSLQPHRTSWHRLLGGRNSLHHCFEDEGDDHIEHKHYHDHVEGNKVRGSDPLVRRLEDGGTAIPHNEPVVDNAEVERGDHGGGEVVEVEGQVVGVQVGRVLQGGVPLEDASPEELHAEERKEGGDRELEADDGQHSGNDGAERGEGGEQGGEGGGEEGTERQVGKKVGDLQPAGKREV